MNEDVNESVESHLVRTSSHYSHSLGKETLPQSTCLETMIETECFNIIPIIL